MPMPPANEKKQLLVFSYGLPVICFFIAWRQYVKHNGVSSWVIFLITAGLFVFCLAILRSPWLKIIFVYWMKAARGIGSVLTIVILSVVYGLVFTPVALVLRLFGKDYMRRHHGGETTYWMDCLPQEGNDQTKQF